MMDPALTILNIFAIFLAGHAFAHAAYLYCAVLLVPGMLAILLSH